MDFTEYANEEGEVENPFSGKDKEGNWVSGGTNAAYLNSNFGKYETADEMIEATDSQGFKKFFAWLRDEKGLLD